MCGYTNSEKIRNEVIWKKVGEASVIDKMRESEIEMIYLDMCKRGVAISNQEMRKVELFRLYARELVVDRKKY